MDSIDRILTTSGLKNELIALADAEHGIADMSLSHKELENFSARAVTALRSSLARDLHQLGHRAFSRLDAASDSFRKFMHLIELDDVKTTISQSARQRHATFVCAATQRRINDKLHERLTKDMELPVKTAYTNRGLASTSNHKLLEQMGIQSGMCPRSVPELKERMEADPAFRSGQKRRASTEARISIPTDNFGTNR